MKNEKIQAVAGILCIITGLALTLFGVFRGEMAVVWQKAVNICLECIGIG